MAVGIFLDSQLSNSRVSAIVRNKFSISSAIITEDYYSYLKKYLD